MSKITLKSSHIYLENELIETIFENTHYVYIKYIKGQERLLITPVSSQWFVKMYEKPTQFLLKDRNLKGDKTLNIREILIDNDIKDSNRELEFEIIEKTKLIKVKM